MPRRNVLFGFSEIRGGGGGIRDPFHGIHSHCHQRSLRRRIDRSLPASQQQRTRNLLFRQGRFRCGDIQVGSIDCVTFLGRQQGCRSELCRGQSCRRKCQGMYGIPILEFPGLVHHGPILPGQAAHLAGSCRRSSRRGGGGRPHAFGTRPRTPFQSIVFECLRRLSVQSYIFHKGLLESRQFVSSCSCCCCCSLFFFNIITIIVVVIFTAVVALTVDSGRREWDRVLSLLPRQRRSNPNRLMISLGIPLFLQTHCHEMFQSA